MVILRVYGNRIWCIRYLAMGLMNMFIQVSRKRHGEAMVSATTPKGAMNLRMTDALGGWRQELVDIVSLCHNAEELENAGFPLELPPIRSRGIESL